MRRGLGAPRGEAARVDVGQGVAGGREGRRHGGESRGEVLGAHGGV